MERASEGKALINEGSRGKSSAVRQERGESETWDKSDSLPCLSSFRSKSISCPEAMKLDSNFSLSQNRIWVALLTSIFPPALFVPSFDLRDLFTEPKLLQFKFFRGIKIKTLNKLCACRRRQKKKPEISKKILSCRSGQRRKKFPPKSEWMNYKFRLRSLICLPFVFLFFLHVRFASLRLTQRKVLNSLLLDAN